MRNRRELFIGLLVVLGIVISFGLYKISALDLWQEKILDLFFIKKSPPPKIIILAIDDNSLNKIGQWPWPRSVLADALKRLDSARSIGIDINLFEESRFGPDDDQVLAKAITKSSAKIILAAKADERGLRIQWPINILRSAADEIGLVNVNADSDGIIRSLPNEIKGLPTLSRALAENYPDLEKSSIRINYHGPAKTFLTIPFIDLIDNDLPANLITDSIFIIGATADDLRDQVLTPFGLIPEAEIHANVLATYLKGNFYKNLNDWLILFIMTVIIGLTSSVILKVKRPIVMITMLIGLFFLIITASAALFGYYILLPILYLLLAMIINLVLLISFQYLAESKEKRFIKKTFQFYLSPEIIEELISQPDKIKLGGESKKITMLFSDIRDFTSLSERYSPEILTKTLNEYLDAMTEAILTRHGLVDKYIGDAIMAFWGAPLENRLQAKDACLAVVEMNKKLKELQNKWQENNQPIFNIGIGLNTGTAVVGNIGSRKRFNYSLIGDEVNFCSRLEGLNKIYGTTCLISESTKQSLGANEELVIRELDVVTVKGKSEPKKIFELLGMDFNLEIKKVFNYFSEGRKHYIIGNWLKAIENFKKALTIRNDGPSLLFIKRCEELIRSKPAAWNGIYNFKDK